MKTAFVFAVLTAAVAVAMPASSDVRDALDRRSAGPMVCTTQAQILGCNDAARTQCKDYCTAEHSEFVSVGCHTPTYCCCQVGTTG